MRVFFWLWIMFLLVCLVTDSASYWLVRSRLSQSLELSLDAALVSGIAQEDLIRGRQLSHTGRAAVWALDVLKRNMEGPLADSVTLQIEMRQEKEKIWASGKAKVELPYLLGKLAGRGSREIRVNKQMSYQGSYK